MPKALLAVFLALVVAACGISSGPPIVEVREITCPSIDPPALPPLPPRPNDLRLLEPDRYRIEGIWSSFQIKWDAYLESYSKCP